MDDHLSCWCFVSYAWGDDPSKDDDESTVSTFFKLIEKSLAKKIPEDLNAVGFLDKREIDNGDDWKIALSRALRGCRAFIPLYTQRYFTREACGREWAAFAAREALHKGDPGLVLPILWDKPVRVDRANLFPNLQATFAESRLGNDLPKLQEYKRLGMGVLMERFARDAEANTIVTVIVDALTDQIVERWDQNRLPAAPAGVVADWDVIVPTFGAPKALAGQAAATRAVHVAVAAATVQEMNHARKGALFYYPGAERDWVPYAEAASTSTTQLALEAAVGEGLPCKWLDARNQLVRQIRTLENSNNEPVLLLVDPWSLEVKSLEQALSEFDQQRFRNAMVIVACNPHEKPGQGFVPAPDRWASVEKKMRSVFGRTFPTNGESADVIANVRDIDAFRKALTRALRAMRGIAAMDQSAQRPVASPESVPMNQN